jgi:DMATS type aromatic prenyltransferase
LPVNREDSTNEPEIFAHSAGICVLTYASPTRFALPETRRERKAGSSWSSIQSFGAVAAQCLASLCDAVGFSGSDREAAIALMLDLMSPWAKRAIGTRPSGLSNITDEHFPIEFSLALEDGVPEVRVLFEAQADVFRQSDLWQAGWAACEKLEQKYGVSLERLRQVADLFEPSSPSCNYAIWHGISFSPSGPPKFKVYLNPLAQGADRGPAVIRESLARLGFASAMQDVFANSDDGCEFRFFSLDLSDGPDARVKVYRVHHDATRDEIESWLRVVPGYSGALVDQFWATIAGPRDRFSRMPVSTYLSLNSRSPRPSAATIHFPVRNYAQDDLDVYQRVQSFLRHDELIHYERAMNRFPNRPLAAGLGMHSYVSVRLHSGPRHSTVYLSPEAYRVDPPGEHAQEAMRIAS